MLVGVSRTVDAILVVLGGLGDCEFLLTDKMYKFVLFELVDLLVAATASLPLTDTVVFRTVAAFLVTQTVLGAAVVLPALLALEDGGEPLVRVKIALPLLPTPHPAPHPPRLSEEQPDVTGRLLEPELDAKLSRALLLQRKFGHKQLIIEVDSLLIYRKFNERVATAVIEQIVDVVKVKILVELLHLQSIECEDIRSQKLAILTLDQVLQPCEQPRPQNEQHLGPVVDILSRHVEGHRIADNEPQISEESTVGLAIVVAC
jgi:hypothetical protein